MNPVEFSLIDPEGVVHRGENVRRFAAKHGLDPSGINKVHAGDKPQYRGWTADTEWYESVTDG